MRKQNSEVVHSATSFDRLEWVKGQVMKANMLGVMITTNKETKGSNAIKWSEKRLHVVADQGQGKTSQGDTNIIQSKCLSDVHTLYIEQYDTKSELLFGQSWIFLFAANSSEILKASEDN